MQTGKDSSGSHFLLLANLEFFGKLTDSRFESTSE
jgi:hypothetical protein